MCSSIGIDPLASNKGFWSDLLGVGDFYYEIGVQILQIGVQTRSINGGIMSLQELLNRVQSCPGRSKQRISRDDVKRAIEKIGVLGSGVKLIQASYGSNVANNLCSRISNVEGKFVVLLVACNHPSLTFRSGGRRWLLPSHWK